MNLYEIIYRAQGQCKWKCVRAENPAEAKKKLQDFVGQGNLVTCERIQRRTELVDCEDVLSR